MGEEGWNSVTLNPYAIDYTIGMAGRAAQILPQPWRLHRCPDKQYNQGSQAKDE